MLEFILFVLGITFIVTVLQQMQINHMKEEMDFIVRKLEFLEKNKIKGDK